MAALGSGAPRAASSTTTSGRTGPAGPRTIGGGWSSRQAARVMSVATTIRFPIAACASLPESACAAAPTQAVRSAKAAVGSAASIARRSAPLSKPGGSGGVGTAPHSTSVAGSSVASEASASAASAFACSKRVRPRCR